MRPFQSNRSKLFFATLSLPATACGLALSVQLAALSWLLSTQFNLNVYDIGLVWAAGPLAGIFGQVIIGTLSDRVWIWNGRRRAFIIIGGTIAALALLALPQIGVINDSLGFDAIVGIALTITLALDFAVNVGFNPTRSLIADVTEDGADRTRGYTWMQTVSGSVSVGGYAIGAIFDNYVLIYTGAVLVFLFSVIPPLFIEEPRELVEQGTDDANEGASIKEYLLSIKPLWGFLLYSAYAMSLRFAGAQVDHYYAEIICGLITLFLVGQALFTGPKVSGTAEAHHQQFQRVVAANSFSWIGIQTTFVYMIIYIQQQFPNLSDTDAGRSVSLAFLILNAVGALVPLFVLRPISDRIGRVATHAGALGLMAAGYLVLYAFVESLPLLYVVIGIIGIGWGSIVSLPFAIMSQTVEGHRMGLYMGLFNLSIVLPQLTVSLGIALAVSRIDDKSSIFLISAIALAISALAWTRVSDYGDAQLPVQSSHH